MASARRTRALPQGYEPAKGFPPPEDESEDGAPSPVPLGQHTHLIGRNTAVCGVFPPPTDAGLYVTQDGGVAPTCPKCLAYYQALLRQKNPSAKTAGA